MSADSKPLLGDGKTYEEHPLVGQLLGLLCAISWVIGSSFVQLLQGSIPPLELNCWRFGGPLPLFLIWIVVRRTPVCQPPAVLLLLIAMSLCFTTISYTFFGSLDYIGIGSAESISASSRLIFTALGSFVFLKEKIGVIKTNSIVFSIFGVVFVTQPDFIFHLHNEGVPTTDSNFTYGGPNSEQPNHPTKVSQMYIGYIMVLITGLSSAGPILIVRGTRIKDVPSDTQVIYGHFLGFIVSAVLMGCLEKPVLPHNINASLYLSGHIFFTLLGTVSFYAAINIASGVLVALAYTSVIVFSMAAQYAFMENIQPGHRNILEICGAILVLISASMNPLHQLFTGDKKKPDYDEFT